MKTNKKIMSLLITVALVLCSITTNTTKVEAATTSLTTADGNTKIWVRSLNDPDVKADCTSIVSLNNNAYKTIVIDFGDQNSSSTSTLKNLLGTKAYNSTSKTLTIDHLVFTHSHTDHANALNALYREIDSNSNNNEFKINKVIVKNLYINALYFNGSVLDNALNKLFNLDKFRVNATHVFGAYDSTAKYSLNYNTFSSKPFMTTKDNSSIKSLVNLSNNNHESSTSKKPVATSWYYYTKINEFSVGKIKLTILPAYKKYKGFGDTIDENSSSLLAVVKDNSSQNGIFKFDFMGDIQAPCIEDLSTTASTEAYIQQLMKLPNNGTSYKYLYYKVPHHGIQKKEIPVINEMTLLTTLFPTHLVGTGFSLGEYSKSVNLFKDYARTTLRPSLAKLCGIPAPMLYIGISDTFNGNMKSIEE